MSCLVSCNCHVFRIDRELCNTCILMLEYPIALFANAVRRYHEYALGLHPGARRTNY